MRVLLLEHRHLPLILRPVAALTARGADHGKHGQRFQCGARHEDALRVRALVGRVDQKSFGRGLREVGGHEAFEDLAVFKAQPHPQSL